MEENPFGDGKKTYCTFYIVRHGETEWNVKRIVQGHSVDSPLTLDGQKQVEEVARELSSVKFDTIYSSDLVRAKRTAEIIALEHKIAVFTTKLLRERKYGEFEGKSSELLKEFNKLYDTMSHEERFLHKIDMDAESDEELMARFITFIREIAITHINKTILVVTHGGLMRVFLQHIGFGDMRYFKTNYISNASHIKLLSNGIEFFVKETKGIKTSI